jgi:TM2 domain-containing membrane protein YozV
MSDPTQPPADQGWSAPDPAAAAQPQQGYYPQQQPAYGAAGGAAKSRMTAGLLGIFIGYLGVHNFYLGYTTKGIIQLVLTLTCFGIIISSPWGLIEGILILTKNENFLTDADGVPLTD